MDNEKETPSERPEGLKTHSERPAINSIGLTDALFVENDCEKRHLERILRGLRSIEETYSKMIWEEAKPFMDAPCRKADAEERLERMSSAWFVAFYFYAAIVTALVVLAFTVIATLAFTSNLLVVSWMALIGSCLLSFFGMLGITFVLSRRAQAGSVDLQKPPASVLRPASSERMKRLSHVQRKIRTAIDIGYVPPLPSKWSMPNHGRRMCRESCDAWSMFYYACSEELGELVDKQYDAPSREIGCVYTKPQPVAVRCEDV